MDHQTFHIREIRELARKYTPEEMDGCIKSQIEEGANVCHTSGPPETIINELAKAGFVRDLMDKGVPLNEAVRILAERIRLVQKGLPEKK
ncbi:MAG: hypothetical protein ACM34I_10160 [bacterium]